MTTHKKLQILNFIKIGLIVLFVPIFLFYLILVVPEYLACTNCYFEGEMGTDIWGDEIQCFGDSKELGEVFFQFSSEVVGVFLVLIVSIILIRRNILKSQ